MTPQEIFDEVATKLLAQKYRSYDMDVGCVYRGPNGNKCAVGHLIPDDMYRRWMDLDPLMYGSGVQSLVERRNEYLPPYFKDNVELLSRLQRVHDEEENWLNREVMAKKLADVASYFGLHPGVLRAA